MKSQFWVHVVTLPLTLRYYKPKSRGHLEFIPGFAPECPQRKQFSFVLPLSPPNVRISLLHQVVEALRVNNDQDRPPARPLMNGYCEDRIGR